MTNDATPMADLEWKATVQGDGTELFLHPQIKDRLAFQRDDWMMFLPLGYSAVDIRFDGTQTPRSSWHTGMATIIPPDTATSIDLVEPVEFICFAISDTRASAQISKVAGDQHWHPKPIPYWVDSGVQAMAQEIRRSLLADPLNESAYFDALSDALLARVACQLTGLPIGNSPIERLSPGTLRNILKIIEDQIGESIVVEDLASEAKLSRSHFTRAFKATVGESPQAYILDRRVKRAQSLLSSDEFNLAEVADMTGFSSQSHLSRVFKKRIGTTPGKYRSAFGRD